MRKASFAVVAMVGSVLLALPAVALGPETFNGFTPESPLTSANSGLGITDADWRYTPDLDVNGDPKQDVAIEGSGIDGNTLRISNAYTDSAFGNWLFSPRLPGGGVQEDADGNKFIAEYEVKSTSLDYQPGLQVSVSPQSRDGARMSFLRFEDSNDGAGGIDVYFADYQDDAGLVGRTIQIANNQPRSGFTVRIELDLYTGPNNDVAQVFINDGAPLIPMLGDGFTGFFAPVDNPDTANKVKAGQSVPMKWKFGGATPATTWEQYYRENVESNRDANGDPLPQVNGEWETRKVDSLIFQARSGAGTAPGTLNGGFLFDNVELTSGNVGTLPKGGVAAPGDASFYGDPVFKWKAGSCADVEDFDALETADVPGASHLTYDAATGIWHYNWQTNKSMAGAGCVKLTLVATGDYAIFKISK